MNRRVSHPCLGALLSVLSACAPAIPGHEAGTPIVEGADKNEPAGADGATCDTSFACRDTYECMAHSCEPQGSSPEPTAKQLDAVEQNDDETAYLEAVRGIVLELLEANQTEADAYYEQYQREDDVAIEVVIRHRERLIATLAARDQWHQRALVLARARRAATELQSNISRELRVASERPSAAASVRRFIVDSIRSEPMSLVSVAEDEAALNAESDRLGFVGEFAITERDVEWAVGRPLDQLRSHRLTQIEQLAATLSEHANVVLAQYRALDPILGETIDEEIAATLPEPFDELEGETVADLVTSEIDYQTFPAYRRIMARVIDRIRDNLRARISEVRNLSDEELFVVARLPIITAKLPPELSELHRASLTEHLLTSLGLGLGGTLAAIVGAAMMFSPVGWVAAGGALLAFAGFGAAVADTLRLAEDDEVADEYTSTGISSALAARDYAAALHTQFYLALATSSLVGLGTVAGAGGRLARSLPRLAYERQLTLLERVAKSPYYDLVDVVDEADFPRELKLQVLRDLVAGGPPGERAFRALRTIALSPFRAKIGTPDAVKRLYALYQTDGALVARGTNPTLPHEEWGDLARLSPRRIMYPQIGEVSGPWRKHQLPNLAGHNREERIFVVAFADPDIPPRWIAESLLREFYPNRPIDGFEEAMDVLGRNAGDGRATSRIVGLGRFDAYTLEGQYHSAPGAPSLVQILQAWGVW